MTNPMNPPLSAPPSSSIAELTRNAYAPLLKTDEPLSVQGSALNGVIDESTFKTIGADLLFGIVNRSHTVIGREVLYRSFAQPPVSGRLIRAKQEALRELQANPALREKLEYLVKHAAKRENYFYQLLYGEFIGFFGTPVKERQYPGYGYTAYGVGRRFLQNLATDAAALPQHESAYLRALTDELHDFRNSEAYDLAAGTLHYTAAGLKTAREKRRFEPSFRFRPTIIKPLLIISGAALITLISKVVAPMIVSSTLLLGLSPGLVLYVPSVGGFDRDFVIYPLRKRLRQSPAVRNALEALGKLDELLCFLHYAENSRQPLVLPEIIDSERHEISLSQVRNPVLAANDEHFVPNDIALNGNRLAFITGPNSGGKTVFCKTLAQVQLLAQIGCFVPAAAARLSPAEKIYYQVPEAGSLEDRSGRFGKELQRTREIFFGASPQSLVVLDELSEGTTFTEKMEISKYVLEGFHAKGNNTILVTHNHELCAHFGERDIGLFRQMEIVDGVPTHVLMPGIASTSHAQRVAEKIGFTRADVDQHLKDSGFERPV